MNTNIEIGSVWVCSWGYDQTQHDFLVVIGFTKSGKSAICRMCKAKIIDYGRDCNDLIPDKENLIGEKFKMQIKSLKRYINCLPADDIILSGKYPYIIKYGENHKDKRRSYFYKADSKKYTQTFGH